MPCELRASLTAQLEALREEAAGDVASLRAEMSKTKKLKAQLAQVEQERAQSEREGSGDAAALKLEMSKVRQLKVDLNSTSLNSTRHSRSQPSLTRPRISWRS